MTKSSKSWWGRFLFQDRGILPTNRLISLFFIITIVLVMLAFRGLSWEYVIFINLLILVSSFFDLFFSPKKKEIEFLRNMPDELERGLDYTVEIEIRNNSDFPLSFRLIDDLPQSFQRPFPVKGTLSKKEKTGISYLTRAPVRGEYTIQYLYFRYRSVLGLWEKQMLIPLAKTVKVIPDLTETRKFLEDAQKFLIYEGTQIRKFHSGMGDFAQIRNYVIGDDPRKINWRQTAKMRTLMTNEYEPEHGKYITILIDCGRIMGAELKKGNRLEKALEAAITVAAAALKKGDYVSVLAFSKEVNVYVPPAKGMDHLQRILKSIYNLQVDPVESNYGTIFTFLDTMQKKRSLLLLFSDVRTFLHEENTLHYLLRLRRRHLFLMIGIEDRFLVRAKNAEPNTVENTMIKTIAQQQLLFKKNEKRKWERQGIPMVEAQEEKLAVTAVSQYFDIMNRQLL